MNPKVKLLAEQAGFMFWENEPWRPGNDIIDWSSNYDNELQKFSELIIEDICKLIHENEYKLLPHHMHRMSAYAEEMMIKEHFGMIEK